MRKEIEPHIGTGYLPAESPSAADYERASQIIEETDNKLIDELFESLLKEWVAALPDNKKAMRTAVAYVFYAGKNKVSIDDGYCY